MTAAPIPPAGALHVNGGVHVPLTASQSPQEGAQPHASHRLRDMTPAEAQAAECLFQKAKAIYREACAFLDEAVEAAVRRLPQLEKRKRGAEIIHRYPEKNLDVMLALMLIKIRGNINAGEALIESGFS